MVLENIMDSQLLNLRTCGTSRPEIDIKAVLEPLSFCSVSLHEEHGQLKDIKSYIKSVVSKNRSMQRITAGAEADCD